MAKVGTRLRITEDFKSLMHHRNGSTAWNDRLDSMDFTLLYTRKGDVPTYTIRCTDAYGTTDVAGVPYNTIQRMML